MTADFQTDQPTEQKDDRGRYSLAVGDTAKPLYIRNDRAGEEPWYVFGGNSFVLQKDTEVYLERSGDCYGTLAGEAVFKEGEI
jgi:hypothetical protein